MSNGDGPDLPVGDPVALPKTSGRPERGDYEGRYVTLHPVDPRDDAAALYASSHGDGKREAVWTYMGYGPFSDPAAMQRWLESVAEAEDPVFLTVVERLSRRPVGMVSFLNIVPDGLRLELGHIWYSPEAQRTAVNTEAIYLMLCETFDRLKYRRAEWKCDGLNAASCASAVRLGFRYEGTFKQHLVVKGRNRDTSWYAMLDRDWPTIKANMELWLYDNPGGKLSLRALNGVIT